MDELKIRPLKRKDRKIMTGLLRKLADNIGDKGITKIIVSDAPDDSAKNIKADDSEKLNAFAKVGVELLKQMLDLLEDDLAVWFADLAGIKKEDIDEMPFGFEANIIDQIVSSEEVGDFFMHALRASSRIKEYGRQAKILKTESASASS